MPNPILGKSTNSHQTIRDSRVRGEHQSSCPLPEGLTDPPLLPSVLASVDIGHNFRTNPSSNRVQSHVQKRGCPPGLGAELQEQLIKKKGSRDDIRHGPSLECIVWPLSQCPVQ
ncbi:hypothetical protein HNY73_001429 [Argiope bruennichi]|uniref:Uncharacterized protein n=1 Tax=Argiope bruennichi TaxID=94029 RepID=A0A8T0G2I2_ARGBR|nr:hypothetical protein HNY73_001429 [Argiope bruennichi]